MSLHPLKARSGFSQSERRKRFKKSLELVPERRLSTSRTAQSDLYRNLSDTLVDPGRGDLSDQFQMFQH